MTKKLALEDALAQTFSNVEQDVVTKGPKSYNQVIKSVNTIRKKRKEERERKERKAKRMAAAKKKKKSKRKRSEEAE